MRKYLSLLLFLVLMFSSTLSFASVSVTETHGELLKELGLVKGDSSGLAEDRELTRGELVSILVRLKAYENLSFTLPDKPSFSDVPKTHWAFENVEKAKAWGITTGVGDGKFGVSDKVNLQQAVTFISRLLGDEVNWNTILSDAKLARGIYSKEAEESKKFTRGMMFQLINLMLLQNPVNSDNTMLDLVYKSTNYPSDKLESLRDKITERVKMPLNKVDTAINPVIKTDNVVVQNMYSAISKMNFTKVSLSAVVSHATLIGENPNLYLMYQDSFEVTYGVEKYKVVEFYNFVLNSDSKEGVQNKITIESSEGYGIEQITVLNAYKGDKITYGGKDVIPYILKGEREYYSWNTVKTDITYVIFMNYEGGLRTGYVLTEGKTYILE